ncbi:MAG TPA: SRPBCC domain-containing protein, partial [Polyangiaceae bacterium]|nr:SRPBCC domain-containing protein [Polyangiaceae bacterium]
TEIAAPLPRLHAAISTLQGLRGWLAADTQIDTAGRYTFAFGPRVVGFELVRADERGTAMTCVREQGNPDWLGTELTISLTPAAGGNTRVTLAHTGYRTRNECYTRCLQGWEYFLSSLALFVTTGKGTPFETTVTGSAPVHASVEVAS